MEYDGSWSLYVLEGDQEELDRSYTARKWVVIRKEISHRCFFETIDYRPQTAFDWPHSMLATSRQRILIHSSNP